MKLLEHFWQILKYFCLMYMLESIKNITNFDFRIYIKSMKKTEKII